MSGPLNHKESAPFRVRTGNIPSAAIPDRIPLRDCPDSLFARDM